MRGVDDVALSPGISVDQLIALSDEMSALVRAGVPLDKGLVAAGRDLRGRAGALATRLGERIERGEALDAALAADGRPVPAFYRAVIEAGLRTGRLPTALEGLATYGRSFAETRRMIGLALIYPLMVLMLGYGLFVVFVVLIAPRISAAFEGFHLGQTRSLAALGWLGANLVYWVPVVPILLVVLLALWMRSGLAATLRPGGLTGLLRFIPGLGSILLLAQSADFADLLSLMVEHGVPLDAGIELAAEAAGAPGLRTAATGLAEGLRRGDPLPVLTVESRGLPPMLRWVLATTGARGALAPALRHAAATYRRRALRKAEAIQTILPTLMLFTIGVTAAIVYTVSVIQPIVTLWYSLAIPRSE
jgi:type II secretory pathway component PulF